MARQNAWQKAQFIAAAVGLASGVAGGGLAVGCGGPPSGVAPSGQGFTSPARSTPAPQPASHPTTPLVTASVDGERPPPHEEPSQPEAKPASAVDAQSDREAFPSGLVVSQRFLGGPAPGPSLPAGTRVLHIGDSFAGALGIELGRLLTEQGVKSRLAFETSTYIPTWAWNRKLASLVQSSKPDLVLISLGANELSNPEPEKRIPTIRRLVDTIAPIPCVWVAPVLWDGAKPALLEVIARNIAPCVYLDSNAMVSHMPRTRDGIHPSMASRPDWAKAVLRWLSYHRRGGEGTAVWHIEAEP